jgi:hydrogenase/urease accessory protein HupE
MLNDLQLYFGLGYEHIINPIAWDHVLFIIAICMLYIPQNYKLVVWLITSFTIGHSITLLLTAFKVLHFPVPIIEFLIPVTIAIVRKKENAKPVIWQYANALFFGMIHGVAFATEIFGLEGKDHLISKVLGFNLGIEFAQILVITLYIVIALLLQKLLKIPKNIYTALISLGILIYSLYLAYNNYKLL